MKFNEILDRPVVTLFLLSRKIAGGQFFILAMESHALAALPFQFATRVGARAILQILLYPAFHKFLFPSRKRMHRRLVRLGQRRWGVLKF
jgi:hypothetical protein